MKMISLLEERIKSQDKERMTALIIADYYEIVKELITAILLIEGYKTLSHKDLIEYIKDQVDSSDVYILDDLRVIRNRVAYEGFFVEVSYLTRNEISFKKIIKELKKIIEFKLKDAKK